MKGLFRGGGGGGGSEGGGGNKQDKLVNKVARVLMQNTSKKDRSHSHASERPFFNPEEHISEKREWSRRYTQSTEQRRGGGGGENGGSASSDRLFEHFAVVGLPPNINIRAVAADIKTYQRVSKEAGGAAGAAAATGGLHITAGTPREERQRQYGLKGPTLQAEVLYSYPPSTMPADLEQSLAAFAFPHGVRPELLERTPSMSALNEVIYSQPYQTNDDHSFVFLMKVAHPGSVTPRTLYGVCCYVRELVHRPPSMAREAYPGCNAPLSRYLVVAPRCYCLLTHHPFFSLHFRVLQTILGLERLERMTSFASELAGLEAGALLSPSSLSLSSQHSQFSSTTAASSSMVSSSAGATSTPSISPNPAAAAAAAAAVPPAAQFGGGGSGGGGAQQAQQGTVSNSGSGSLATATGAAAAGGEMGSVAGRDEDGGEGAESESSSTQRWTEGSGGTASVDEAVQQAQAAVQQQAQAAGAGELAGSLQQLALADQQQLSQQQQQQRPSRLSQVSPYCPTSEVGTSSHSKAAEAAAAGDMAAETPPNLLPLGPAADGAVGAVGAEVVGATPFFTPADHFSPLRQALRQGQQLVAAEPASHQAAGAAAAEAGEQPAGSSGSTRRVLEGSLSAAGAGAQEGVAADAVLPLGRRSSSGAGGRWGSGRLRGVSAAGQGQGGEEEVTSDSESYLSASSSMPLLPHQQAATPQRAGRPPLHPTAAAGSSSLTPSSRPSDYGGSWVDLNGGFSGAEQAEQPLPLAGDGATPVKQQQGIGVGGGEGQQQQQAQRSYPPSLLILPGEEGTPEKQQRQGQQQQQQQVEPGSGVEVQIVTRSLTSSPVPMAAFTDGPPRADLLTGTPLRTWSTAGGGSGTSPSNSARWQAAPAPPVASPEAEDGGGGSPVQLKRAGQVGSAGARQAAAEGQEGQEGQEVQKSPGMGQEQGQEGGQEHPQHPQLEVVRVTASNLDWSRPLRPADLLAVYRGSIVPRPGQVFEFQPDPGLQTIAFERPDPVEAVKELGLRPDAASLPDIDAAQNLGGWAVSALCRSMSLDNLLTFLTAALLERQIVVFCPNAGLLSGIVLSLVPLLLPFHWQCLLLPVLPAAEGRLELMEAPVPFVLGVMYKTPEVRTKCSGLVRVNVYKDKIKNAGQLPPLPQQQALHDALAGTYAELRKIGLTRSATTRPVHMISDAQQVLAECFLSTLQKYLKGLMADLRAYCITDVSASMERTSVLLKDSFVDSFPPRDRPFMRQFAETQMFSVYTDAVLG